MPDKFIFTLEDRYENLVLSSSNYSKIAQKILELLWEDIKGDLDEGFYFHLPAYVEIEIEFNQYTGVYHNGNLCYFRIRVKDPLPHHEEEEDFLQYFRILNSGDDYYDHKFQYLVNIFKEK